MVNVLVVDDSSFVRRTLSAMLEKDPDIRVVATAANGAEAIELARKHDPDVITMDVEMPRMSGLDALQRIMAEQPCPVIMISSLTSDGAQTTLKALELGALDFMAKLSASTLADLPALEAELAAKVKALARRKPFMRLVHQHKMKESRSASSSLPEAAARPFSRNATQGTAVNAAKAEAVALSPAPRPLPLIHGKGDFDAVFIGASTGGPDALRKILMALPAEFPVPILIAQHMPAAFTGPFAQRLNSQCSIAVKEADAEECLRPGFVYVCPGGRHLRVEKRGSTLVGIVTEEPKTALYKPSVNVLIETGGIALGHRALSVMLTGMGSDGLEGTKTLKAKEGHVIAQSEATCVVYGMPKAVVDAGIVDEIVDIDDMAAAILTHFSR